MTTAMAGEKTQQSTKRGTVETVMATEMLMVTVTTAMMTPTQTTPLYDRDKDNMPWMCRAMMVVAMMLLVRGGRVTKKLEEVAMVAAEEVCGGQVVAVQCIGSGSGGGNSSGVGKGEGEGSGYGSDDGCCGDVDFGGGGDSNNDSDGGDGNSNSGSGIEARVMLVSVMVEGGGLLANLFFWAQDVSYQTFFGVRKIFEGLSCDGVSKMSVCQNCA